MYFDQCRSHHHTARTHLLACHSRKWLAISLTLAIKQTITQALPRCPLKKHNSFKYNSAVKRVSIGTRMLKTQTGSSVVLIDFLFSIWKHIERVARSFSSPSHWLTVGFWLLTPGGPEVSTGLFSHSHNPFSLLAKSLSYDYRPGWKSLSAIIKDAFIPLPQVLVGVCVCAFRCLFPCLHACARLIHVCGRNKKRRSETEEGAINVCVCVCVRAASGGVLCVEVDRLCVFLCVCLWCVCILQG